MSNLFEALKRADGLIPQAELQALLEGQVENGHAPIPPLSVPDTRVPAPEADYFREAVSSARPALLRVAPTAPILPFDGSHWGAGEMYRMVRTKINQHPKAPQILVVTSAGPSDGKTVTAINLAGALALKNDAPVLFIDGDFRRSTACTQLGLATTPGLAEVLTGAAILHEALVRAQQIPSLYVLPAGKAAVNPAELLDSSLWRKLIEFARAQFKYVIIDSPPIGAVTDYEVIQDVCDGAILVVRPDHTDRQLCFKALSLIPKDKLLGVVLNCVDNWFLNREGRYGAYYHYGAGVNQRA